MKKLRRLFMAWLQIVYQNPVKVSILFILIFLVSVWFSKEVKPIYDIQDTIDADFTTFNALEVLKNDFGRKHNLTLLLSRADNRKLSKPEHCQFKRYFEKLSLSESNVKRIESTYNLKKIVFQSRRLFYPNIMELNCEEENSSWNKNWRSEVKNSPWSLILSGQNVNDIVIDIFFQDDTQPKEIEVLYEKIKSEWLRHNYKINITGSGAYQIFVAKGFQQANVINLIIMILILLTIRIFFRNWKSGLILIATLAYTSVVLYGIMGLLHYPIDFLTHSLFSIISIAVIEDFIFLIYVKKVASHHWKNIYRKLIIPTFFTSLTTCVGFLSLMSSDLHIIKRFALVTAIGSIIEWLVIFSFLPALQVIFKKLRFSESTRTDPQNIKNTLQHIDSLNPNSVLTLLLCVFFVLWIPASQRLQTNDSPSKVFSKNHIFTRSTEEIKADRGWETQLSVLYDDYSNIKKYPKIIDQIKQLDGVIKVENPLDVNEFYLKYTPENFKDLVLTDLENSYYYQKFKSKNQRGQIILYINNSELKYVLKIKNQVELICQNKCELANGLVSYTEFGEKVPRTLYHSMLLSLILVASILIIVAKITNTPNRIAILLSSFWGPCFIVSTMWLSNVNINYMTCIFASICLGLAGDNAIQYMFAKTTNTDLNARVQTLSKASLILSLILMMIPLAFSLSYFVNMVELGILFFIGMLANVFGDLFLLRSFLSLIKNFPSLKK